MYIYTCICHCCHSIIIISIIIIPRSLLPLIWYIYIYVYICVYIYMYVYIYIDHYHIITTIVIYTIVNVFTVMSLLSIHYPKKNLRAYTYYVYIICIIIFKTMQEGTLKNRRLFSRQSFSICRTCKRFVFSARSIFFSFGDKASPIDGCAAFRKFVKIHCYCGEFMVIE